MKKTIVFPNNREVLNLGQGTWRMGEDESKRDAEIEALRTGIDKGLNMIDTAEMYADGKAESIVGAAIKPYKREDLFLVSKIYPYNASKERMFDSCEQSLNRMGTDYIDLYLLHWRGDVPLQETIDCFEELKSQGKIRDWGVSNFDLEDMKELLSLKNGKNCQTNQLLYHLASRGIEAVLTDYLKENNIPVMAYCPIIGQEPELRKKVNESAVVNDIAENHGITTIQLLLAFVLQQDNMIAIPKAGSKEHVVQNIEMFDVKLSDNEMTSLNREFPVPDEREPLDVQ
ncbi:MAG: aldo/keto reductase [Alkalibacterium sp.]|nr:aldo/keto reductase [Alkalibacterium sp.]